MYKSSFLNSHVITMYINFILENICTIIVYICVYKA